MNYLIKKNWKYNKYFLRKKKILESWPCKDIASIEKKRIYTCTIKMKIIYNTSYKIYRFITRKTRIYNTQQKYPHKQHSLAKCCYITQNINCVIYSKQSDLG